MFSPLTRRGQGAKNSTMTECGAPIRNRLGEYKAMAYTLHIISGIFVIQRFYLAWSSDNGFRIDDLFVLITFLLGLASLFTNLFGTAPNGLGKDIWTLLDTQITKFGEFFYVQMILYTLQIMFIKLSLLFFYIYIFPRQLVHRLLWITVTFNVIYGLFYFLMAILQCRPISFFWERWDGEHTGHCVNINVSAWSHAIISIGLDFWILILPFSQLRHLKLNWKAKVGVGMMFCVGTLYVFPSITD